MIDRHALVDRYLAAWNEPDAPRRRDLIAATWAATGRYEDPLMRGEGREGIAAMIETARAAYPGIVFTARGEPDGHGAHLRFAWSAGPAGGAPFAGGTDVAVLDAQGRFVQVTGFLDPVGPAATPALMVAHLRDVVVGPAIVAYLDGIDATLAPFGGRFRVHGARPEVIEGDWTGDLVVIEFPDRTKARDWYGSAAYRAILPLRRDHAAGEVILVETVDEQHRATDVLADLSPSA